MTTSDNDDGLDMANLQANKGTSEKAHLVKQQRRVSLSTAIRLRFAVLVVSWISVVVLAILGLATLVMGMQDRSTASLAFFLDAWLDVCSSIVVIWRFYSAKKLYSSNRERLACIILGVLFMISAVSVVTKSSLALMEDEYPKKSNIIWYLSTVNGVVCIILASSKIYLARRLESMAVGTDAVNSVIGGVLAFSTVFSDLIYQSDPRVWYLDATLGIICSFFLLGYGIWLIVFECRQPTRDDEETDSSSSH